MDPIRKALIVRCPPAVAFDTFARQLATWWPLDSHAVSLATTGRPATDCGIDLAADGEIWEIAHDGVRHPWGRILALEAGRFLEMTWHPGRHSAQATRITVTFDRDPGGTRVILVHDGWRPDQSDQHARYISGWDFVFAERYASAADAAVLTES